MLIKPLLVASFQKAINSFLAMDKNSHRYLMPLAGKVIALTIQPFNETIYLCPSGNLIQCLDFTPDPVDTHISGSLLAFGMMSWSSKPMRSIFSGKIKIEGDSETGRKFQQLFEKLDINLEDKLAQFTGPRLAHGFSQVFRSGQEWSAESWQTFKLNLTEFIQEETRDLPSEPEVEIFCQQIVHLRVDSERLSSRIERLQNALAATDIK